MDLVKMVAAAWAALVLSGCTPALDWREFRAEGTALRVRFPCRPAGQEREVELAGRRVAMRIYACQAQGIMFALGHADVVDPALVGPALHAMLNAGRANITGRIVDDRPAAVAAMTPHPQARAWRLAGQLDESHAHAAHLVVFAHGTQVAQATVGGPQLQDEQVATFVGSLEIRP